MEAMMTKGRDHSNYETFVEAEVTYPESDGRPMADNTKQYRWIVTIKEGLESLFADDPDVFVAADLFWYPVRGDRHTKLAPDVMVAFGSPKEGDRGSYRQWEEGDIAPQVVFEIRSPGNTSEEMKKKFDFYERRGVEEYYLYDPDRIVFEGWVRSGGRLRPLRRNVRKWVSPRLGVRFDMTGDELAMFGPDGERFLSPLERQRLERERAEKERKRAEKERKRAEKERKRAEKAERKAKDERGKMLRLAEKLRELGINPETL